MILSAAQRHPVSAGLTMILSAVHWHPVSVGTDDDLECYQSFMLDAYSSLNLVKKIVLTSHLRLQNHG